jgi:Flp pilus assembly protein TadG
MPEKETHPKRQSGQSLVELAISLVVILTLLAGIVDLGMAFFSWVAIRDASQEGAIFGAVCPNDANAIIDRVRDVSSTPVNLADEGRVTVNVVTASGIAPGNPIEITVIFDYQSITPGLSGFLPNGGFITLSASTTNTILTTTNSSCP